jgi:hypothetical protein
LILKKKISKLLLLDRVSRIFKKLIFSLGLVSFLFIAIIITYYYTSNLQKKFSVTAIVMQVNDKVLDKYIGFNLRNAGKYFEILNLNLFKKFQVSSLEKVYLKMDQKTILGLELQRKIKFENNGELTDQEKLMLPAKIHYNGKKFNIKMRTKGARLAHYADKDQTSYKIDIRGEKRLWGMEEFSFQKPITKNYTYEYLFHNLLGHVGLAKVKYFFVNLYINDQNSGVYAVEESFSKEIIERQNRRNGPIFSTRDEVGEYFPNIAFELYSENFWTNEYPELISNLFSILNNIKKAKFYVNDYFDIDKWAKYFAIMDLTGGYHGSLIKSVKLYYNPTTALFEPIGYDFHKGAGIFDGFILMDFLQEDSRSTKISCSFICGHKEWYLRFLKNETGELNNKFITKYIKYLKEYSDENFVNNFLKKYEKDLSNYNLEIYKDYSKADRVRWKGAGFFVYDENYLLNRAKTIRNKINKINLTDVDISKKDNLLYFEDYLSSEFPIEAQTTECSNQKDSKKYFFAGTMKINLITTCKKIRLKDNNNNFRIIELKNNFTANASEKIHKKKKFNNLSELKNIKKISNTEYAINFDLNIEKNLLIKKNEKITLPQGIEININNNAILFVEGEIAFLNDNKNFTKVYSSDGTGSLIFNENNFKFKNVIFQNLSKPELVNYILYGGVNFINSNVILENIIIKDSNNEDGINIINSKSQLTNLYFNNIKADALDIDFGEVIFKKISCKKINNDCLDISGATVYGDNFTAMNVFDKGVSAGENSNVIIKNINLTNNHIALAVKDGSTANFDNITFKENTYDIALFNKKQEFLKPKLIIDNLKNLNKKKIIQSIGTTLLIENSNYYGSLKDEEINSMIY